MYLCQNHLWDGKGYRGYSTAGHLSWIFEEIKETSMSLDFSSVFNLHCLVPENIHTTPQGGTFALDSGATKETNGRSKKMLFSIGKFRHPYKQDPWIYIAKLINVSTEQVKRSTQDKSGFAALVDRVVPNWCNSMVTGLLSGGF